MSADYRFRSTWRVTGTAEEVVRVLTDVEQLTRWWPSVNREVQVLAVPNPRTGMGARARVRMTGWLPYHLVVTLTVTEPVSASGFAVRSEGDLVGTGRWSLTTEGPRVRAVYDWHVRADKALLRRLSWALRPLFRASHGWAMRQGERSLELELARRRALHSTTRQELAAPPAPTFRRLRGG